jgi:citrate synthase
MMKGASKMTTKKKPTGKEPFHHMSAVGYKDLEDVRLRGYFTSRLGMYVTPSDGLYLEYTGELPTIAQSKMLNYLMILAIDHGFSPPVMAARMVTSGRPLTTTSIGVGLLAFGEAEGNGLPVSKMIQNYVKKARSEKKSLEEIAEILVEKEGPIPLGFVHLRHPQGDPRAKGIFSRAKELKLAGDHVRLMENVENVMAKTLRKKIPLNFLGAASAALLDIGLTPEASYCIMIGCRAFSCGAHALEETERESPWRASVYRGNITDILDLSLQGSQYYDGPPNREVPKDRWPGLLHSNAKDNSRGR